jgi:hypothetical protein
MISSLWHPIQEYINSINGSMPAVHHYTNLRGALGILESGRIWFTERAHLNDPTEIRHGIEIANGILREQGRRQDAECLRASADRVFANFRFFSASFSLAYDDTGQWTNYADNGRGVLLSFKAAVFDRPNEWIGRFIAGNSTTVVCPMSYESERLRSVITSIITCWNGRVIEELGDYIFMISSMFKNDSWKSEKEYRYFVHRSYPEILKSPYYKTHQRGGDVIPYLDLPIRSWDSVEGLPIYRICLGPAAPPEVEGRVAASLRKLKIGPREGILRSGIS